MKKKTEAKKREEYGGLKIQLAASETRVKDLQDYLSRPTLWSDGIVCHAADPCGICACKGYVNSLPKGEKLG